MNIGLPRLLCFSIIAISAIPTFGVPAATDDCPPGQTASAFSFLPSPVAGRSAPCPSAKEITRVLACARKYQTDTRYVAPLDLIDADVCLEPRIRIQACVRLPARQIIPYTCVRESGKPPDLREK
ncbi:hypothetical protein GGS23DRAFT_258625 [Durotheca rogersii]|uniref:uncharacterized protein n=1 Tax=Durotheca rogersii TaxID=419775 RepID=UPI00221E5692|nr:uncharacterized protein GGS23DRAFT_258625 [Durotheca rogersii]KAI5860009.1 hypothetical protein GGS23DRAFT_258625 [Durotheca rogersii]